MRDTGRKAAEVPLEMGKPTGGMCPPEGPSPFQGVAHGPSGQENSDGCTTAWPRHRSTGSNMMQRECPLLALLLNVTLCGRPCECT